MALFKGILQVVTWSKTDFHNRTAVTPELAFHRWTGNAFQILNWNRWLSLTRCVLRGRAWLQVQSHLKKIFFYFIVQPGWWEKAPSPRRSKIGTHRASFSPPEREGKLQRPPSPTHPCWPGPQRRGRQDLRSPAGASAAAGARAERAAAPAPPPRPPAAPRAARALPTQRAAPVRSPPGPPGTRELQANGGAGS